MKEKCFACHGEDPGKVEGKLNLLTREGMLRGGESSQRVLVAGNPARSDLYRAITWEDEELEMPPKANDRLSEVQVAQVREWIAVGAPWPDKDVRHRYLVAERAIAVTADGEIVGTSGGLSQEWTYRRYRPAGLWALRPVARPAVPGDEHPIDVLSTPVVRKPVSRERSRPILSPSSGGQPTIFSACRPRRMRSRSSGRPGGRIRKRHGRP